MPITTYQEKMRKLPPQERAAASPATAAEQKPYISKTVDMTGATKVRARLVSDRKVPLSMMKAQEHLDLARFKGERNVSAEHAQFLYDEHQRGRFMFEHVILASAKMSKTGEVYGINGQHTCWMRALLDGKLEVDPKVRYLEYEVDNEDELRRLYGVFDTNMVRSNSHLIKALLAGTEEMADIWPSSYNRTAPAMKLWLFEDRHTAKRYSAHEMAHLITGKYHDLFKTVTMFWQHNCREIHLKRASVLAAMLATFHAVPTKATEFWQPVADGLTLSDKTDPRYRLRDLLLKVTHTSTPGLSRDRIMGTEDLYRCCIQAWNKWRRGEKVDSLRPTNKRIAAV